MAALVGKYKAKVSGVSLGGIGKNDSPAIEVSFKVYAELVGAEWKDVEAKPVRKPYWLSDKIISKGKAAGKTSIELTRDQIKETYQYEGGLTQEDLEAGLMGKEVELTCKEAEDPKYTEVEYVNPPGGGSRGFKRKPVADDKLAQLAALWSGKAVEEKVIDPSSLFKAMTEGAA